MLLIKSSFLALNFKKFSICRKIVLLVALMLLFIFCSLFLHVIYESFCNKKDLVDINSKNFCGNGCVKHFRRNITISVRQPHYGKIQFITFSRKLSFFDCNILLKIVATLSLAFSFFNSNSAG